MSGRTGQRFAQETHHSAESLPMPVVARIDPKTVFTSEEWGRLTSRSAWRPLWLVVHAWGTIAAAVALVALWPNPLTGSLPS